MSEKQPIPLDVAIQLCQHVRQEKGVKLFSQCWGCVRFSKGDPAKMCLSGEGNRGCRIVNEEYEKLQKSKLSVARQSL